MKKLVLFIGLLIAFSTMEAAPLRSDSRVDKYKSARYKKRVLKRGNKRFKKACKYTRQWKH